MLYPGLCAEEFIAITETFVKDVLRWDVKTQKNTGQGLFGTTQAFTQATEEQGRKTLHAHFLVWIEGWMALLDRVMLKRGSASVLGPDLQFLQSYAEHCASSSIFHDFGRGKVFSNIRLFQHDNCRKGRREAKSKFTVVPVCAENFAKMRDASECHNYKGKVAHCPLCSQKIQFAQIAENAVQGVFEGESISHRGNKRRMECTVYEMQKDFRWWENGEKEQAQRLLLSNLLSNTHNVLHSTRCFKKAKTCYATFPREPQEKTEIIYSQDSVPWATWDCKPEKRWLFEVSQRRLLEDAYTNTHNKCLTKLFLCNNNVAAALTGACVFYATTYTSKSTQTEEKQAYEEMTKVLFSLLTRQEENPSLTEDLAASQLGFRRLLLAVYSHTKSLVIASPMAHFVALHGSRFVYSHQARHLPLPSLSRWMAGEKVRMRVAQVTGNQRVPFCSAMNIINRPEDLSDMPPYEFVAQMEIIPLRDAKASGRPFYRFQKAHPKERTMAVVRREQRAIPIVDWTFFGDAKTVSGSITKPPPRNHWYSVSADEENHCRKILLCFAPYRCEEDIRINGSYKRKFLQLHQSGELDPFICIIQNIQNIRNSLDAGRISNNAPTIATDPADPHQLEDESNFSESLQNQIAQYFQDSSEPMWQDEGAEAHELNKAGSFRLTRQKNPSQDQEYGPINRVFRPFDKNNKTTSQNNPSEHHHRYVASGRTINELILSQFFMRGHVEPDFPIKPTGTAESIIAYGIRRDLDAEQQIAFEILTGTVVLSFLRDTLDRTEEDLREATTREQPTEDLKESIANIKGTVKELEQLVHEATDRPLRMFITGPAGAGKCK